MHDLGTFIYDDPNHYVIEGESAYEIMFPSIKNFLDENEALFDYCALHNKPFMLNDSFGEAFEELSKTINDTFFQNFYLLGLAKNDDYFSRNSAIEELIQTINLYKKGNAKNV